MLLYLVDFSHFYPIRRQADGCLEVFLQEGTTLDIVSGVG